MLTDARTETWTPQSARYQVLLACRLVDCGGYCSLSPCFQDFLSVIQRYNSVNIHESRIALLIETVGSFVNEQVIITIITSHPHPPTPLLRKNKETSGV